MFGGAVKYPSRSGMADAHQGVLLRLTYLFGSEEAQPTKIKPTKLYG